MNLPMSKMKMLMIRFHELAAATLLPETAFCDWRTERGGTLGVCITMMMIIIMIMIMMALWGFISQNRNQNDICMLKVLQPPPLQWGSIGCPAHCRCSHRISIVLYWIGFVAPYAFISLSMQALPMVLLL